MNTSFDKQGEWRFRRWLQEYTPYKNSEEFFIMLVMDKGVPPHPITDGHLDVNWKLAAAYRSDLWEWRQTVSERINEMTPPYVDPSIVMRRYLKWLQVNQKSSRLSRP